jgi:hypothetical protein
MLGHEAVCTYYCLHTVQPGMHGAPCMQSGQTPLHKAAASRQPDNWKMMKALLKNGADPHVCDRVSALPVHHRMGAPYVCPMHTAMHVGGPGSHELLHHRAHAAAHVPAATSAATTLAVAGSGRQQLAVAGSSNRRHCTMPAAGGAPRACCAPCWPREQPGWGAPSRWPDGAGTPGQQEAPAAAKSSAQTLPGARRQ